jgi:hypothetical protein
MIKLKFVDYLSSRSIYKVYEQLPDATVQTIVKHAMKFDEISEILRRMDSTTIGEPMVECVFNSTQISMRVSCASKDQESLKEVFKKLTKG